MFPRRFHLLATVLVFAAIPLFFGSVSFLLQRERGPCWLGTNRDPTYAYLMNSLLLLNGKTPGHVDHPGTPVQILGALLIKANNPSSSASELTERVFKDPESELARINAFLIWLSIIAIFIAGIAILNAYRSFLAGILFQTLAVGSATTFWSTQGMSPEPLLIPITLVFSTIAACLAAGGQSKSVRLLLLGLLGILGGVGIATKVTFFPVLLIGMVLSTAVCEFLIYGACTAFSAALFLLPALPELRRSLIFWESIATHTGQYGGGAPGLINTFGFLENLCTIAQTEPLLLASWVLTLLLFLMSPRHLSLFRMQDDASPWVVIVGTLIAQVGGTILVAKHYAPHYLLPVLLTLPLSGCLILKQCGEISNRGRQRVLEFGVFVVYILTVVFNLSCGLPKLLFEARNHYESGYALYTFVKRASNKALMLDYSNGSSPESGLEFGNVFSKNFFGFKLAEIYPHYRCLDGRGFIRGFPEIPIKDKDVFLSGTSVYVSGESPIPKEVLAHVPSNCVINPVFEQGCGCLYKINVP